MTVSNTTSIYISIVALIAFIAIMVISKIIAKKSALEINDSDFISNAIGKKKQQLVTSKLTFQAYIMLLILLPICAGVGMYFISKALFPSLIAAIMMIFIPDILILLVSKSQNKHFEERYARSLKALVSCLRSSMTINQAIDDVAQNPFIDSKIQEGFKQIGSDIRIGVTIQDAFMKFAKKFNSQDAYDVASAIAMQTKVGGSEAKIIESIAFNIQNRIMLRKEIKSAFSETDVMVRVMELAPWLGLVVLLVALPDYTRIYFESITGILSLVAIMSFTIIGSFVIHKKLKKAKMG